MTERFRQVAALSGTSWMEASGSRRERVEQVLVRMEQSALQRWNFAPPIAEMNKP